MESNRFSGFSVCADRNPFGKPFKRLSFLTGRPVTPLKRGVNEMLNLINKSCQKKIIKCQFLHSYLSFGC